MKLEPLTLEHVKAKWRSPMRDNKDMNEGWMALRREMLKASWAKERGLRPEDVGIAVHPKSGKVYFQWEQALKFLPQKPA